MSPARSLVSPSPGTGAGTGSAPDASRGSKMPRGGPVGCRKGGAPDAQSTPAKAGRLKQRPGKGLCIAGPGSLFLRLLLIDLDDFQTDLRLRAFAETLTETVWIVTVDFFLSLYLYSEATQPYRSSPIEARTSYLDQPHKRTSKPNVQPVGRRKSRQGPSNGLGNGGDNYLCIGSSPPSHPLHLASCRIPPSNDSTSSSRSLMAVPASVPQRTKTVHAAV